jgi:hypothetical protein
MITEAAGGVRDLPNIVLGVLEKFDLDLVARAVGNLPRDRRHDIVGSEWLRTTPDGTTGALKTLTLVACLAAMLALGRGTAATADDLYRARTIVTGQEEEGRSAGFAECLECG